MHHNDLTRWRHRHDFNVGNPHGERRTYIVIGITATMMLVEIVAGRAFNSMALLADGWHMSTHVAAFAITAAAYWMSRRNAQNPQYTFGTGKIGVLGGFASAIVLAVVALLMAIESIHRFLDPLPIQFGQAIGVAVIGLLVNVVCALLLKDDHHHGHHHQGSHSHHHEDLNLRSAYIHVLADALTSVTAIGALVMGALFGWAWMDPVMGVVGSAVIAVWAYGLVRDTSGILLDRTPADTDLPVVIREAIESDGDASIYDLHVWQVGAGQFAAIVGIVAHAPKTPEFYRELLREHEELVHVSLEVQSCSEESVSLTAA